MHLQNVDPATIPATAEELLDLLTTHCKWVRECVAGSKSWMPHVAVLTRPDPTQPATAGGIILFALALDFNGDEEKRATMLRIGRQLFSEQQIPAAAVMSSEAWTAPDCGPGKRPVDSPERREVITVAGSSMLGIRAVLRSMPITRTADDVIVPGEWSEVLTEGVEPRLLNQIWTGFFEHVIQKFGMPGGKK